METQPRTILKKIPSSAKTQSPMGSPSRQGIYWKETNLAEVLQRASDKNMKDMKANMELADITQHIANQRGEPLIDALQQIQQNVSVLKPRMENFVLALLRIRWFDQDKTVVAAYREFLRNLVTAQIYFTKPVVKMLVSYLKGLPPNERAAHAANAASTGDNLEAMESLIFDNIHQTLQAILTITPLAAREALLKYTKEVMPYGLTPDSQTLCNYMSNLLRMTFYRNCLSGSDKLHLLTLVVDRLVQIDAHVDKDRLEQEEDGTTEETDLSEDMLKKGVKTPKKSPHLIARTNLDRGMKILVAHIDTLKGDEALKSFYFDLVKVFESHVLPVHTGHVQFVMFYLMGRYTGPALTTHFLELLWKKFQSPSTPSVIRQAAMSYIASLTSRAKFVSVPVVFSCLEKVSQWIHSYIAMATGQSNPSLTAHAPFYAACQALFYMFVFRHEELTLSKKHLAFLRTLHLNTIVTCRLNPLFYCLYQVVANFSAIARNYQLAYCETVIQRNNRISLPSVDNPQAALSASKAEVIANTNNHLDSFFPFDPYRLPGTRDQFQPFYRGYNGATFESEDEDEESESESEEESETEDETKENSSEEMPVTTTKRKTELDEYLMEIEDSSMVTPKAASRAKRMGTDSVLSTGSVGQIDFGYGSSPGFKQ